MPITNETDTPNRPEEGRDIRRIYIENTSGAWLRHNRAQKEIELWYDGKLLVAYENNSQQIMQDNISALIGSAIEHGKHLRSAEIKKLIG